ncbi:hypothetical protein [Variovorax paradoxus]|uniref:hypothetical protein n=1 Tax=Variovorax paradoxus TaxID=34073 RepID=UPI0038D0DFAA
MAFSKLSLASALAGLLALSGCQTMDMQMGSQSAKTVATGSAAGAATSGESSALERCDSPLGTVSLIENVNAGWYTVLTGEYKLPPTANLLRLLVQQSNCFVVVERGAAGMNAMTRERALQQSGEMRGGSNFGRGQMVASDYGLSPEIVFSNNDAGGLGGAIGGLVGGGRGRAIADLRAGRAAGAPPQVSPASDEHRRASPAAARPRGFLSPVFQRCRVSAGGLNQLLLRPSMYITGAATSSSGVASSRQLTLMLTYLPPTSATSPRPKGRTPQWRQNRWCVLYEPNW